MNIKWTDSEKKYIRDNAHRLKDVDLAKDISKSSGRHVSLQAVRKMRQKLGVKKQSGRGICKIEPKKGDTEHFIK